MSILHNRISYNYNGTISFHSENGEVNINFHKHGDCPKTLAAELYQFLDYLGGKCKICGEKNPFVLSFHHIKDKEFGICQKKTSNLESISKEIDKCELLCNNCHIEKHTLDTDSKFKK